MSTPSDTMRTATIQGSVALREPGDAGRRARVVAGGDHGPDPVPGVEQLGDAPGVVLVGGDHQAGGVGLGGPQLHEPLVGLGQHGGQPPALERQRGAQPLGGPGGVEGVVEAGRVDGPVGRGPLHVPVDPGEVHGPHHPPVGQGVAVAVLEVGGGDVALVADEGDGVDVAAERGAGQGQALGGGLERPPH
jgi:hypothetical protein